MAAFALVVAVAVAVVVTEGVAMARGEPPRVNNIVGGQTANHQAVAVGVATAMAWDSSVVKRGDGEGGKPPTVSIVVG